ncbi:hypothetical protein JCM10213v2_001303 [Rhodosporidiobolus nylandii]
MSSAAAPPVMVPKHSREDDDHALVLPGSSSNEAATPSSSNSKQSATAALSRALAGMLAFMFKRPIRLFRPVKISTWAGIQAIAEEQGRPVTPGFASESFLLPHLTSTASHLLLIPFISGGIAGAAQALLSAPLDNARLLLLRRQRFLRLSHAAASSSPRARRSRLYAKTSSAAGVPFVSWMTLLRESVFQSGRNAMGGSAATTARDRLEQGRRWARRGWSLFNLSLVKDSIGFGTFFLIFEVGREASRVAGLKYDGIDPDKPEDEGKQRRSASGLVLQALGILVSGGLAGWVFSLVARPFERMRGAIWEGRARWAERDGRLKVIEELALAGHDPLAHDDGVKKQRRRRISAGGASERRANELVGPTGRKEFRVRIGRIRTVSRSDYLVKRRKARQKEHDRLLRRLLFQRSHTSPTPAPSAAPPPLPPSPPSPPQRQPMPSASSLIASACARYGAATFLFAPRSVLQLMDAQKSTPSALGKPLPPRKLYVGPTRLSARGRKAVEEVSKQASGRGWRAGARVLSYVPPYAIGLLFYALTAGDLKIEV